MFTRMEPQIQTFNVVDDYTIDDLDYNRKKFAEDTVREYSKKDFPKWKRIGLTDFKKLPIEKYKGKFMEGNSSFRLSEEAVKDERLRSFLLGRFDGADPKFTLMALSFFNTGFFSNVKDDSKVKARYDLNENKVVVENSGILLENGSSAVIIRENIGTGRFFNSSSRFLLKSGSKLKIFNIFITPKTDLAVESNLYDLEDNAVVEIYDIIFGGQKTVLDQNVNLRGKGSKATLKSVYFGRGKERLDLKYSLNHFERDTYGRIESKGILADEAYSVFRGNIDIKKEAFEANSEEKSSVLNLSPKARADSIPSLFVDNSSVTAKHGASVGNIDEDKLYYLMSRGLDERSAVKLIVTGIFGPFLDDIPSENSELKGEIEDAISIRI